VSDLSRPSTNKSETPIRTCPNCHSEWTAAFPGDRCRDCGGELTEEGTDCAPPAPGVVTGPAETGANPLAQKSRTSDTNVGADLQRSSDRPHQTDIVDQLVKLTTLRDSGALSQAEFEIAKTHLLGASPGELDETGRYTAQHAAPGHDAGAQDAGPGRGTAQDAPPTSPTPDSQLPLEDLVWTCAECGKENAAVRPKCWGCGHQRGSAEVTPREEHEGWVPGVPKSVAGFSGGGSELPVRSQPLYNFERELPENRYPWASSSTTGESTWGPLWLSLLAFAPIGFGMALWRLSKHYGTYREGIALAVSSAQILDEYSSPFPRRATSSGYDLNFGGRHSYRQLVFHFAKHHKIAETGPRGAVSWVAIQGGAPTGGLPAVP
jgi:hypothetical protein